jgi:hypothetical protein
MRIGCRIPVMLYPEGAQPGAEIRALCRNLSGGGMGLVCDRPIAPGTRLGVVIPLKRSNVQTDGWVVRSHELAEPGPDGSYEVAISFDHPDPALKDSLVQTVLDRQRVLLQRRLDTAEVE